MNTVGVIVIALILAKLGTELWLSWLNRCLHNKSSTADNQVTVVGGRNIGDEYFGAADDVVFAGLDVLTIGIASH